MKQVLTTLKGMNRRKKWRKLTDDDIKKYLTTHDMLEFKSDKQREERFRLKRWYNNYKDKQKCKYCSEPEPRCLTFHHRKPETKIDDVSSMVEKCLSFDIIRKEIAKCDVVCLNCHVKINIVNGI